MYVIIDNASVLCKYNKVQLLCEDNLDWPYCKYRKGTSLFQAADLIRSALMGHTARRQQMTSYPDDTEDDYVTDDEDYNECVNLIQSSLFGHQQRKNQMRDFR